MRKPTHKKLSSAQLNDELGLIQGNAEARLAAHRTVRRDSIMKVVVSIKTLNNNQKRPQVEAVRVVVFDSVYFDVLPRSFSLRG
jgi:hypothetical protein